MPYLKSVAVGIVAVIIATALYVLAAGVYINATSKLEGDGAIGWDPVSFARSRSGWLIIAVAFLVGFFWELHGAAS